MRLEHLQRLANALGLALFASLFVVFVVQIGARFVLNQPLPWTDELAVVLYLWVVLWGCTALVKTHEHVAFDAVFNALPTGWQRAATLLQAVVLGGLCAWALPACWDYVQFMQRESTPVLGLSMRWVFMPFVLLLLAVVVRSAAQIQQSFRKCAA